MIFFTRRLYNGYQPSSGWERRAMSEWDRNREVYQAYRHIIAPLLPRSIVQLTGDGLHDSVVKQAATRGRTLTLTLDTSGSFSRFRPRIIRITFSGLKNRVRTHGLVGQWWLYEEVHLSARAAFNLHVMFTESELEIEADDVKVERLKAKAN